MGDEKHGLLRVCRKQTAVQFALGGFVERAADLIEQEDVASVEQSAGDSDTLGLAFTESTTPLSKFGVKAVGQVEDEVGTGGMHHCAQLVVSSIDGDGTGLILGTDDEVETPLSPGLLPEDILFAE